MELPLVTNSGSPQLLHCYGKSMRCSLRLQAAIALTISAASSSVSAVEQPGGPTIPLTSGDACWGNVGVCINDNEQSLGGDGDIDVVETATIDQEIFNPLCNLTFQVVARGASYENTFGWYEVTRDSEGNFVRPELGDLHVFLGCDDDEGTERTLSVPEGISEVGFFLANDGGTCVPTEDDPLGGTLTSEPQNLFFSQRGFNPEEDGLLHMLAWQSRANPEGFYFGWEDLNGGGDNDFEDLLTLVTGLQCTGGGEPCDTGADGVCAQGVTQCVDGRLACVATQEPREERCNAIDDDCNSEIDDGDLCDEGHICHRGECVPPCSGGEFPCPAGLECDRDTGVCRDPACVGIECPPGEVCADGECVGACESVVCPYGHDCRAGVCVDVCAGFECDSGYACEVREVDGAYVGVCSSCDCRGCGDGFSCVAHLCVADTCASVDCDTGEHCVNGECVDDCEGAVCPSGQRCEAGACVGELDPLNGTGGGSSHEGGSGNVVIVLPPSDSSGGGGTGDTELSADGQGDSGGCGCRTSTSGHPLGLALFAGVLMLGLARRRR